MQYEKSIFFFSILQLNNPAGKLRSRFLFSHSKSA